MVSKATIAYFVFTAAVCYFIAPWFFEKNLFFNELLALIGLLLLAVKKFRIGKDTISICMVILFSWGILHMLTSLFLMDGVYYYLRNLVILYSMFTFFIGYFLLPYLGQFLNRLGFLIKTYLVTFLIAPINTFYYDRFSTATLFPVLFKDTRFALWIWLLIPLNLIHAINYESSTSIMVAGFNLLILISPGYKFFKQTSLFIFFAFICLFVYLFPYLDLIKVRYSPYSYDAIFDVANSHPLLSVDHNSTWRLILWKEILIDNFPRNIFGFGFGTPMLKYFPVEDYSKLDTLPYVLGAHNSYVYLFGRLGIVYLILTLQIYSTIFKEYFHHKKYYQLQNRNLIFLSFFAMSVISLLNPTLETPIYAGIYWLILGLTARCIHDRKFGAASDSNESAVYS